MSLVLDNVTKSFRAEPVLAGLSLDAADGETVVVFGPSGTGKTVLLRLIAGIDEPDSGDIRVGGRSMTGMPPDRRGVGMAFQNFALYPHMTAYENIASPLEARGDGAAIKTKVEAIARLLKIDHVLSHPPRALSNGQKQRTALARALVGGPKILLLDDPLRNVDAKLRYEMRLELPRLLDGFHSTTLYVTQDYKEAMALGDRIAVLQGGSFAQLAPPSEIYLRPATTGVARLFGEPAINLIRTRIEAEGGRVTASLAGSEIELGEAYGHAAGREILLGVRPEDIAILSEAAPGAMLVEVVAVTPLNERVVTLLHLAGKTEAFASAPEDGDAGTRRHGPAFAQVRERAALVFDAETGRRVAPAGEPQ